MKYLLAILSGLEISDGVFTDYAVGQGFVNEGNPIMDSVVSEGNFLFLKVIGALLCIVMLWLIYKKYPRVARAASSAIIVFYITIMTWNAYLFLGT